MFTFVDNRLTGADPDELYRWKWTDDASPGHSYSSDHNGTETQRNFTVTYPTSQVTASFNPPLIVNNEILNAIETFL